MKITSFGEVLWDNLPSGKKLGGAPLNVLVRLRALGAEIQLSSDALTVRGGLHTAEAQARRAAFADKLPVLPCRESGSTLRFLIPPTLCCGGGTFLGTERLIARGFGVYEDLLSPGGVTFQKSTSSVTVHG